MDGLPFIFPKSTKVYTSPNLTLISIDTHFDAFENIVEKEEIARNSVR